MKFKCRYKCAKHFFLSLHRQEAGAFLLLSLVGVLIVFMMALSMYDTGKVTRYKLRSQAAVDTSAYSGSIVRARAMNMIAFGNVAKRSTVGIVVGYENVWQLLDSVHNGAKVAANLPRTKETIPIIKKGERVLKKIDKVWKREKNDYSNFKRNIKDAYVTDLLAIDNVQKYFNNLSPWWIFSEVSDRGRRNGLTAAATYPVPEVMKGTDYGLIGPVMDKLSRKMGNLGGRNVSKLPIRRMTVGTFFDQFKGDGYLEESGLMLKVHKSANENADLDQYTQASIPSGGIVGLKADELFVYGMAIGKGYSSYKGSFSKIAGMLGDVALPYVMANYDNDRKWLYDSSLIVLGYKSDKRISGLDKERYRILPRKYDSGEVNYNVEGSWNMATSEIFFKKNGKTEVPDMWHTMWSARIRPVGIEGEWHSNGVTFLSISSELVPYLVISAALTGTTKFEEEFSENDVEILSNMARGIDAKGIRGIGK